MQTISDIYAAINPLPALLADKGKVQPDARFQIEANAQICVGLTWTKPGAHYDWERHYEHFIAESGDKAMAKALAFIASLPSAETAKLHDFMGKLGKVIDEGNSLGISVDYLNPLTETMKRLSENVITYQKKEAA